MEDEEGARYEFRAWAETFPNLPRPDREEWHDEVYLIPLGLLTTSVKIRGDALEIKDLVAERPDMQLWLPVARLTFPVPAHLVERELIVRLALGQKLHRERFTAEELLAEVVEARGNVAAVRLRKRRRLFEAAGGCRAEVGEVEVDGRRTLTACVEHAEPERVASAAAELGIDRHPNLDYPTALARLVPLRRHG